MRTLDLTAFLVFFALAWQVTAADTGPTPEDRAGRRAPIPDSRRANASSNCAPWLATDDWKPVACFRSTLRSQRETLTAPPIDTHRRRAHGCWTSWSRSRATDSRFATSSSWPTCRAPHCSGTGGSSLRSSTMHGRGQDRPAGSAAPIAGTALSDVRQLDFGARGADLSVTAAASTSAWELRDVCNQDWARCYRFEYNRPLTVDGVRSGWSRSRSAVGRSRATGSL